MTVDKGQQVRTEQMVVDATDEEDKYLVFTIDGQDYALEIHYVIDIIGVQQMTFVPYLSECIKGIINLRGSIIPIMDVRLRVGLPEIEYTDRTCFLVVDNEGVQVGLVVDAVKEVTNIPKGAMMPPPVSHDGIGVNYVKGISNVSGGVQLLVDCNRLMDVMG